MNQANKFWRISVRHSFSIGSSIEGLTQSVVIDNPNGILPAYQVELPDETSLYQLKEGVYVQWWEPNEHVRGIIGDVSATLVYFATRELLDSYLNLSCENERIAWLSIP